jgi:hypothetical protein
MVQQFKHDIGDKLYGKIRECSGLRPSGESQIYGYVKSTGDRVSRPT